MNETEDKKEKPFYKTKEFWLEVVKVAAQAGVYFGMAYLTQKAKRKI
jgi:hypothetical protein